MFHWNWKEKDARKMLFILNEIKYFENTLIVNQATLYVQMQDLKSKRVKDVLSPCRKDN